MLCITHYKHNIYIKYFNSRNAVFVLRNQSPSCGNSCGSLRKQVDFIWLTCSFLQCGRIGTINIS